MRNEKKRILFRTCHFEQVIVAQYFGHAGGRVQIARFQELTSFLNSSAFFFGLEREGVKLLYYFCGIIWVALDRSLNKDLSFPRHKFHLREWTFF